MQAGRTAVRQARDGAGATAAVCVTAPVTNKKAGFAPAFRSRKFAVQSVMTQSMTALRSASLAGDFGWPLADEIFFTAAAT